MGVCMTRCYTEARRLSCWQPTASVEDRDRLVDFDMFLDEEPRPRPVSMLQLHDNDFSSSDVSLLHDSDVESQSSDILFQLGIDNEEIELQEETALAATKEAMKMKEIAENSTQLMNPARLAIENNLTLPVKQKYGGFQNKCNDKEQGACADIESPNRSTPSSAAELEWENEDGLSPLTHFPGNDDISSDTASCVSQLSTPVSNGNEELEWDGHFTSTHISQLDMETERLISEIERLTSGVLQGQTSNS